MLRKSQRTQTEPNCYSFSMFILRAKRIDRDLFGSSPFGLTEIDFLGPFEVKMINLPTNVSVACWPV